MYDVARVRARGRNGGQRGACIRLVPGVPIEDGRQVLRAYAARPRDLVQRIHHGPTLSSVAVKEAHIRCRQRVRLQEPGVKQHGRRGAHGEHRPMLEQCRTRGCSEGARVALGGAQREQRGTQCNVDRQRRGWAGIGKHKRGRHNKAGCSRSPGLRALHRPGERALDEAKAARVRPEEERISQRRLRLHSQLAGHWLAAAQLRQQAEEREAALSRAQASGNNQDERNTCAHLQRAPDSRAAQESCQRRPQQRGAVAFDVAVQHVGK